MFVERKLVLSLLFFQSVFDTVAPAAEAPETNSTFQSQIKDFPLRTEQSGVITLHALPHVEGEVLVKFKDRASRSAWAAAHATVGASVVRTFDVVKNLKRIKLPPDVSVQQAIEWYMRSSDVLYAEPNYIVEALVTPNDPSFGQLWGLHNTGQSSGTPDADIDAPEAWNITTGSKDVVVAVIDTGIDYNHQDLAANMWKNTADCNNNGIDDDGNGYIDDCYGIDAINNDSDPMDDNDHGTHVSGTIGAVGNNAIGVVGVNWNVSIMACKFLDADGSGAISDAIECLDYIKLMKDKGVNIVATNNSWGGAPESKALYDAIDAHRQRGILFIAAAGNSGGDNDNSRTYPASFYLPNVISVAATHRFDDLAGFSNYGKRTVHIGAPGEEILSTTRGNKYEIFSGTSMAAPHVAGVAALLKAQDPQKDWKAIKNLILAGGNKISPLTPEEKPTVTRKRINAHGALTCSNSTVLARLLPVPNAWEWAVMEWSVGAPLDLAMLHINCANSNGNINVVVTPGNQVVMLRDDGVGSDQVAGDGIYSGQWIPSAGGTYTLNFPGSDTVTINVDPDLKPGFPVKAYHGPGTYHGGPAIHTLVGNIDDDPDLEIIVTGLASGPLWAWKADGSQVPGWPLSEDLFGAGYPALGNLSNAFPNFEVFSGYYPVVSDPFTGKLVAYSGSGTHLFGWPRASGNYVSTPAALADIDGDGIDEIFIGEQDSKLHVYRSDGTPVPGWPVYAPLGGEARRTPAIADLDGNGTPEVVFYL